jgi:hypothetical protein
VQLIALEDSSDIGGFAGADSNDPARAINCTSSATLCGLENRMWGKQVGQGLGQNVGPRSADGFQIPHLGRALLYDGQHVRPQGTVQMFQGPHTMDRCDIM